MGRNRKGSASVFQRTYRDAKGKLLKTKNWYIEFVAGIRTMREATDFTNRTDAAEFLKKRISDTLGGKIALSRNVAAKHAMEMLLTGGMIPAEEAQRIGLINRVVEPGSETEAALALARKVAEKSALTVKIGKEAFYRQREMSLAEAYRYASQVMAENMMTRDAEEGICAVLDKRAPHWEDR